MSRPTSKARFSELIAALQNTYLFGCSRGTSGLSKFPSGFAHRPKVLVIVTGLIN